MNAPTDTTAATEHAEVRVTTFGYLHNAPPAGAHIVLDLRHHFRDPHAVRGLRNLTAHDAEVRAAVLNTPGIRPLIDATVAAVLAYLSGPSAGPVMVAVGCAGGRHRAATVGGVLAAMLADLDVPVTLAHRDIAKAVVQR
ncbi:RapZ C-terminal domain-containing protein [Actinomadura welshii]|uniref:RapZ C-terminal domain-containing protein n=1 Tax=Actinomadura welshii TaxID=3103817 RepID=UPI0003AD757C|nr:RNase adapter RapZ [Actinomadura madurae]